jgi:hypothetical protein
MTAAQAVEVAGAAVEVSEVDLPPAGAVQADGEQPG